jgi:hypothetical protein
LKFALKGAGGSILNQNGRDHLAAFASQDIEGPAGSGRVHGFDANASINQRS